ncbi:hypothetical protein RH915_10445 [Serpentinicella sp. ANB-PHB4]|uniref:hypothetical protein n=1 Tax=Serpentinicella sp. ANB-PHB4 TaxID=3074076 RepID=UPI002855BAD2|nr:hypothetical protein [Serpentinicella sp. ANB-PHB4]MDR5659907.1 hypothetical protein [Serpentinicella sp. ANB-PHB4]
MKWAKHLTKEHKQTDKYKVCISIYFGSWGFLLMGIFNVLCMTYIIIDTIIDTQRIIIEEVRLIALGIGFIYIGIEIQKVFRNDIPKLDWDEVIEEERAEKEKRKQNKKKWF